MTRDCRLCCVLTGVEEVPERLVGSIMGQARERFGADAVAALGQACEVSGLRVATEAIVQAEVARAITYGIYMGHLPVSPGHTAGGYASPEDYFESVIWRVIQAHPPALSGGYFGHWYYAPEDAHG